MESVTVSRQDIEQGLESVGLTQGDIVLAHSSLSAFGYVEGGADAVIDALLSVVGPEGTVVMPTFVWDAPDRVFDVANTPSAVGRIAEVFRKKEGAVRSRHFVAAMGKHAEEVMGAQKSAWGRDSTFGKLYDLDARVLLLGVDFNSCTALHMVEEWMQVPYRKFYDTGGWTVILPDSAKVPSTSVEFLRFVHMGAIFARHGVLKTAEVGKARITGIKIRDIYEVTRSYMKKDIYFLVGKYPTK
ncbi:MAG: AAC(3) family N-acetyltransferase [Armatimonadetes bacterium]|nr:AAC(3) family N-acetyltransferase [Armatimonadota bacterium]